MRCRFQAGQFAPTSDRTNLRLPGVKASAGSPKAIVYQQLTIPVADAGKSPDTVSRVGANFSQHTRGATATKSIGAI
jgi:hypothetical protein